ncbi:MAG: methionyl-tRNA formyltransferase [Polyangiaceae bacterium]
MRAVFFGTPAFAVPALDALTGIADVVGVVCQPDQPKGRGLTLTAPPVKARALELGLDVVQPTKLRSGDFPEWLATKQADIGVVIAYGRILPEAILATPRLRCINLHASILPKYRGAAPITWAVVHGETETGFTLMQMDAGMDTGAILHTWTTPIAENETASELSDRLSALGAVVVREGVQAYAQGAYVAKPQDDALATLAPLLKKEDGAIDFAKPAKAVHDHIRGMNAWPGAFTRHRGKTLKVLGAHVFLATGLSGAPGEVVLADKKHVVVACKEGFVEITRLQLEGKKPVTAAEWWGGRGVAAGDVLAS